MSLCPGCLKPLAGRNPRRGGQWSAKYRTHIPRRTYCGRTCRAADRKKDGKSMSQTVRYLGQKIKALLPCDKCGPIGMHAETCQRFRLMSAPCVDSDCRTRTGVHTPDCGVDMSTADMTSRSQAGPGSDGALGVGL